GAATARRSSARGEGKDRGPGESCAWLSTSSNRKRFQRNRQSARGSLAELFWAVPEVEKAFFYLLQLRRVLNEVSFRRALCLLLLGCLLELLASSLAATRRFIVSRLSMLSITAPNNRAGF
ncbi:MAG: uncharacterized protein A8A55_3052, partial [Amphiamblys sp. WSBS2006]